MRIVYDHQIFTFQDYGGISRYYCEIAKRLALGSDVDVSILAPIHRNLFLRELSTVRVVGLYVPRIPKTARLRIALNTGIQYLMMRYDPPDIIHETYYGEMRQYPSTVRTVLTVYDMIHEKLPEFFPEKSDKTVMKKKNAVRRAAHVICISENTKRDVQEIFGLESEKVSVTHLASSLRKVSGDVIPTELCRPYILFVGLRHRYKNFGNLLRAYARSRVSHDMALLCFGGGLMTSDERRLVQALGIRKDRVQQIEGDDQLLSFAYAQAQAFVYPSLYEGFGIPILEAMSLECPVVCSDASAFPEVAGPAAEYFDPKNLDSIVEAIERVVYDSNHRQELIVRGLKRAQRFTWDRCAEEARRVYQQVLSK